MNTTNEKEENYPKLTLDLCDSDYIGRTHSYSSSLILEEIDNLKSIVTDPNQFDLSQLASDV